MLAHERLEQFRLIGAAPVAGAISAASGVCFSSTQALVAAINCSRLMKSICRRQNAKQQFRSAVELILLTSSRSRSQLTRITLGVDGIITVGPYGSTNCNKPCLAGRTGLPAAVDRYSLTASAACETRRIASSLGCQSRNPKPFLGRAVRPDRRSFATSVD